MNIPLISSLFAPRKHDNGLFSIDFVEHGVYLARVLRGGAMPQVLRCEYHDTGRMSAASLEKLRREAKLGGCHFTTLLSADEYQMLLVEAPNVPADEIKKALRWQIKDSLSYRIEDATVDMLQVPASPSGQERAQSLYALAAPNEVIKKYTQMFEKARLELEVIDIPEMAQRNIAALFEQDDRALVLLAFDGNGGLMTFTAGGELFLSRRIEISPGQLQDVNENLRQQCMDRVELELQRSIDYFDRQFNHLSVNRILVCAPDSTGLTEFLNAIMGDRVEKLDLSQVMDIGAVAELADSEFVAHALPALGAALRYEESAS